MINFSVLHTKYFASKIFTPPLLAYSQYRRSIK